MTEYKETDNVSEMWATHNDSITKHALTQEIYDKYKTHRTKIANFSFKDCFKSTLTKQKKKDQYTHTASFFSALLFFGGAFLWLVSL